MPIIFMFLSNKLVAENLLLFLFSYLGIIGIHIQRMYWLIHHLILFNIEYKMFFLDLVSFDGAFDYVISGF